MRANADVRSVRVESIGPPWSEYETAVQYAPLGKNKQQKSRDTTRARRKAESQSSHGNPARESELINILTRIAAICCGKNVEK
jgi:hypothetical protein